jgi:adenylate cyclase
MALEGYAAPRLSSIYGRARDLCIKLGTKELLIQVMRGIWAWSFIRDDLEPGAELAREITELATLLGDPGYRMEAHWAVGCNAFYRGEFITSRTECELGFKLYTPERGRFHCGYTGQNPGVTHQCYVSLSLWFLGYPAQARRRIAQTVALGEELGHPFSHAFALYHETFLRQQCRQGPETQGGGEALQALAEEQGFPFWAALGMLTRGTGLLLQGSCDEAITWLRDGLKALRRTGAGIVVPHFTLWLAEAYGKAGRFDEAFSTLDEASSLVYGCKELFNEAELHRIRGELLLARSGDTDPAAAAEAEACFTKARETAHRQRSRSLELRSATSRARLLHRQGRRDEARGTLAPIYEWFTEGFDTADLQDARTLLDAMAEPPGPSS